MEVKKLLEVLTTAEHLKDVQGTVRLQGGRRESVAEHSWRLTLMANWVSDEFPELILRSF